MTINVYNIYEKKTIVFLNFWFQFLYLKFVQLYLFMLLLIDLFVPILLLAVYLSLTIKCLQFISLVIFAVKCFVSCLLLLFSCNRTLCKKTE